MTPTSGALFSQLWLPGLASRKSGLHWFPAASTWPKCGWAKIGACHPFVAENIQTTTLPVVQKPSEFTVRLPRLVNTYLAKRVLASTLVHLSLIFAAGRNIIQWNLETLGSDVNPIFLGWCSLVKADATWAESWMMNDNERGLYPQIQDSLFFPHLFDSIMFFHSQRLFLLHSQSPKAWSNMISFHFLFWTRCVYSLFIHVYSTILISPQFFCQHPAIPLRSAWAACRSLWHPPCLNTARSIRIGAPLFNGRCGGLLQLQKIFGKFPPNKKTTSKFQVEFFKVSLAIPKIETPEVSNFQGPPFFPKKHQPRSGSKGWFLVKTFLRLCPDVCRYLADGHGLREPLLHAVGLYDAAWRTQLPAERHVTWKSVTQMGNEAASTLDLHGGMVVIACYSHISAVEICFFCVRPI